MYKKYVVVEGDAYSRGVQAGRELKSQIEINYQNQTKYYRDKEDFNYRKWGKMALGYIPAMEKWTPEVLEELHGMAEGANMGLEQILALATAYEKSFSRDIISEKCTSFILAPQATYAQKVIAGQTNEECLLECQPPFLSPTGRNSSPRRSEWLPTYRALLATAPSMLGLAFCALS